MRGLKFIGFSLACALCLAAYTLIPSLVRFVFSLIAIVTAIGFFRSFSRIGVRIGFVVTTIIFFFLFNVIYVMIAYEAGWPIPEGIIPPEET